jgi:hypothetical protein
MLSSSTEPSVGCDQLDTASLTERKCKPVVLSTPGDSNGFAVGVWIELVEGVRLEISEF